ncbi:MAG: phospholipase D-like domain-containing protein [Caldilineaceae bacterium]
MKWYRLGITFSWHALLIMGLVWGLGGLLAQAERRGRSMSTTVATTADRSAPLSAPATMTTPLTMTTYPPVIAGPSPAAIVIAAAHIDSVISGEADEAILLWNIGVTRQPLAGWKVATAARSATFPLTSTLTLAPGEQLWCAATAATFRRSFGVAPACEWAAETDTTVPNLNGTLALSNNGGRIQLYSAAGRLMDTLIYGNESQPTAGWQGVAAQLYTRGDIPREGQIWQRKRDPQTGWPLDTDQATDWAGDLADLAWGRQVRMPGWPDWTEVSQILAPVAATATVTVAVAPEGLYQPLAVLVRRATTALDLSLYTFEHRELATLVADAARRGVRVRLLLEGSPPGGISDFQKWCVATIAAAGGEVRYVAVTEEAPKGLRPRYRFLHAKYGIADGHLAFNGTENWGYDAAPVEQTIPMGGRRGFYLITDAVPVVEGLQQRFTTDWAPERFADLYPFTIDHTKYGGPPAAFVFPELPSYPVTQAPFADTVAMTGKASFQLISAPESAARPDNGIQLLIARAGAGDRIIVVQLYEHKNWGDSTSNPVADPNPRLEALLAAARRGAQVQILLDSYFDDPTASRNNQKTVDYVNLVAAAEGLALEGRLGNPTQGGIHAKLLLFQIHGEMWSAVGSLNGGEVSHKLNREVVVLTNMAAVYSRLMEVFEWDWALSPAASAMETEYFGTPSWKGLRRTTDDGA